MLDPVTLGILSEQDLDRLVNTSVSVRLLRSEYLLMCPSISTVTSRISVVFVGIFHQRYTRLDSYATPRLS